MMKEKTTLLDEFERFQIQQEYKDFWLKVFNIWVRNYPVLKNYNTSEGFVSHNVLYYHKLPYGCFRVKLTFVLSNYQSEPSL